MNKKLRFFTNPFGIINNYALINIKHILTKNKIDIDKLNKYSLNYKQVILDVGVYQLKKQSFYNFEKFIDFNKLLEIIPDNFKIPFDFPPDMNEKYQELFIKKSFNNALKYSKNNKFITSIQYKTLNFNDFKLKFNIYNNLKPKILGLGNLCRINQLSEFVKNIIDYSFSNSFTNQIHYFGCSLRCMKYVYEKAIEYNINISIDNTKWTRACTQKLRKEKGMNCLKNTKQLFFDSYINSIKNKKIEILY